jgi:hypothetical protein
LATASLPLAAAAARRFRCRCRCHYRCRCRCYCRCRFRCHCHCRCRCRWCHLPALALFFSHVGMYVRSHAVSHPPSGCATRGPSTPPTGGGVGHHSRGQSFPWGLEPAPRAGRTQRRCSTCHRAAAAGQAARRAAAGLVRRGSRTDAGRGRHRRALRCTPAFHIPALVGSLSWVPAAVVVLSLWSLWSVLTRGRYCVLHPQWLFSLRPHAGSAFARGVCRPLNQPLQHLVSSMSCCPLWPLLLPPVAHT